MLAVQIVSPAPTVEHGPGTGRRSGERGAADPGEGGTAGASKNCGLWPAALSSGGERPVVSALWLLPYGWAC